MNRKTVGEGSILQVRGQRVCQGADSIALEKIEQGDVIVVNTGEGVPVDGVIVEGLAMVDQHALTGESQPAEKSVGDKVFASTMLIAGKIFVEVEQAGTETASAKIAAILNDSAGYKLSSQHRGEVLADRAVIPTLALGALGRMQPLRCRRDLSRRGLRS